MRSKSRVHLTVSSQATGILEGLAALFTNVRSLACVLPKVVLVVGAPFEGERAVGTLERPYSCVYLGNVQMQKTNKQGICFR